MFPSLDTNGYLHFDPLDPHQTTFLPSFTPQIQSPISHDHHHPWPYSFPFSEDFLDNVDEPFFISQQQQDATTENVVETPTKVSKKLEQKKNNEKCVDGTTLEKIPRRRTMSKRRDRHTKICTAQGPRDRRMRLSLQIARKFFTLQDMLGFDKASKTIEWLISKSKASIIQLKESVAASGGGGGGGYEHLQNAEKGVDETLKVTVSRKRIKSALESSCKKESREKARKRARERTMAKMAMRLSDPHQETRDIKKTCIEGENHEQERSNANVNMVEYQMDSVSIIEKFLGLNSDSTSSSTFKDSEESSTPGTVTQREHNKTSIASVAEEINPISSFSLYDYICY